jgi:hypothetical protein
MFLCSSKMSGFRYFKRGASKPSAVLQMEDCSADLKHEAV